MPMEGEHNPMCVGDRPMQQPTKTDYAPDYAPDGLDQVMIDLTESLVSLELCQRWLQNALNSTTDESFRRLISDVMGDLSDLGSVEGELESLVIGALGSVQSAMEVQGLTH